MTASICMSWPDSASNRHSRHADCTLISTCMKIAQIAPLAESVPPRLYGGTERVVSYLTDELVRLGHDVTLFASADSQTSARLVACAPRALRLDTRVHDALPHHLLMLERVRARAAEFDVLHFHVEHLHLPLFRPLAAQDGDHTAWPPGPARPRAALQRVQRHAAGVDLRQPAPAAARCALDRDGVPRPGIGRLSVQPRAAWRLPRVSGTRVAGERARPRHRDRAPRRHAPAHRREDRARSRRAPLARAHRAAHRRRVRSSSSASSTRRASRLSWATPRRCCFRSTGRSPSAWR